MLLLQTIGVAHESIKSMINEACIIKCIFSNEAVPCYMDACKAMEGLGFIDDWHNFGIDYGKTLAAWERNFDKNWPTVKHLYGDKFYKIWKVYLQMCQAGIFSRAWSIVRNSKRFWIFFWFRFWIGIPMHFRSITVEEVEENKIRKRIWNRNFSSTSNDYSSDYCQNSISESKLK